ncbi:MAG TPA: hypothetical protein VHG28_09205 [Longimicrobiaceae bacterium]|nr:hypothetical protein [Longimicrobiaceae bacterium]
MIETALHPTPRPRDVLREQLRAVGLALRVPAAATVALVGLVTLLLTAELLREGGRVDFHPEHQMLPSVVGLLLPIAVWRGEARFGAGFLWTLPVERRRHALARVFAGWAWLMAAIALFVLWLLAFTLLSGGSLLAEETLRLLPSYSVRAPGPIDPAAVRSVPWTPQPLLWLVPFTAATGTYLLASALALGSRYPLRWIIGTVLGVFLVGAIGDAADVKWLAFGPSNPLESLLNGPYGLDTLFTARTESLKIDVTLSTGESVVVWRGLPDLGQWAAATLLWIGAGVLALLAAASRHREGRPA